MVVYKSYNVWNVLYANICLIKTNSTSWPSLVLCDKEEEIQKAGSKSLDLLSPASLIHFVPL